MSHRSVLVIVSANRFSGDEWESSTAQIWREFAKRFDEVHVVARNVRVRTSTQSVGNITLHLIPSATPRSFEFLLTSWFVLGRLYRIGPTVLIAQSPVHGGVPVALWGRRASVPVVVELHGEHYFRAGQVGPMWHRVLFRPLCGWVFRRVAAIRSLTPGMSLEIAKVYGRDVLSKVVEVPNRVDLGVFGPRKDDYASNGPMKIVTVGGINANKNQLGLMKDLHHIGFRGSLHIVGTGPMAQSVEQESRDVPFEVEMHGQLTPSEVSALLRIADVYVHYSLSEAVPRAVLEAMAIGLPVIVGPAGFLGGVVQDGVNGYRLPALGPRPLANALERMSEDYERQRLGSAGHELIATEYEWGSVFDRYGQALKQLAAVHHS